MYLSDLLKLDLHVSFERHYLGHPRSTEVVDLTNQSIVICDPDVDGAVCLPTLRGLDETIDGMLRFLQGTRKSMGSFRTENRGTAMMVVIISAPR